MVCPSCGANIQDETLVVCPRCGAYVAPPKTQTPNKSGVSIGRDVPGGLSAGKYYASHATPRTKLFAKLSWVAALLCVILFIGSYINALNTSIEDIPLFSFALSSAGTSSAEIDREKKDLTDRIDYIEDLVDDHDDDLTSKERDVVKEALTVLKKCTKNISINNVKELINVSEKIEDLDFDDAQSIKRSIGSAGGELTDAVDLISSIILWPMLIALIFTAIGGALRSRGLVIAGLVFTVLYTLIFCGALFLILLVAAHAVLIYLLSYIKAEYKAYRAATY